jgi:CO/xanthine dehydrogenase FAD-binding subunit
VKPAPFEYDDPRRLGDALALLAEHGEEAKVLAGGQSLVPLLNFRLARPARIVDVNRVDELAYLRRRGGSLRIGALARALALERSPLVAARWPLLREAARLVAHPPIRARGTVAGSVAHADPAAELPAALTALDARFHVRSARGSRSLRADELFVTHLTTALAPDELLVEIEVAPLPPRTGAAFVEHARVHGDFALAGAAAVVTLGGDGACERAAIALCAAAPTPVRAAEAEAALAGRRVDRRTAAMAAALTASAVDVPASAARYRRALVAELTARALVTAASRAKAAA